MAASTVQVTQTPGTVYPLAELLQAWQLESLLPGGLPPSRLRAQLVPIADTDEALLPHVAAGTPTLCSPELATGVHRQVTGGDALAWVSSARWNDFGQKIAFVGGWAEPGTPLVDEKSLTLVGSFSEVIEAEHDRPLNLQMFHRNAKNTKAEKISAAASAAHAAESGSSSTSAPASAAEKPTPAVAKHQIPELPGQLIWPLPEVLDDGANLADNATRVSQKGALTWWHLDDSGEFVFQVGLPLQQERMSAPVLIGPGGKPVVKLFIFADRRAYSFITQDGEVNQEYIFAGLHPFRAADDNFPPLLSDGAAGESADPLPTFYIALLEAGGRPLLSPPNVPHAVLSLQNCVMVEQRRVMPLFLDEVVYFLERCKRWLEPPIIYDYVQNQLRDEGFVRRKLVPLLVRKLRRGALALDKIKDQDARPHAPALVVYAAGRARVALQMLLAYSAVGHFAVDADARAAIQTALKATSADTLEAAKKAAAGVADRRSLEHEALMKEMAVEGHGWSVFPDHGFAAYFHDEGHPRWGPLRRTLDEAKCDRIIFAAAIRRTGKVEAAEEARQSLCSSATQATTGVGAAASGSAPDDELDDLFD